VVAGKVDGIAQLLQHSGPFALKLDLNLNVRDRDGNVDPLQPAVDGSLNVRQNGAVPAEQVGVKAEVGNGSNRLGLILPHGGNADFQFLHSNGVEELCDRNFFFQTKGYTGSLFAVSEGGVVDVDGGWGSHGFREG
jgi:hypothetical protein